MKINSDKTKVMSINFTKKYSFMPTLKLEDMTENLEVVHEIKLLGILCTSDAKWSTNTNKIIKKAASKLWILRRLKKLGADTTILLDTYRLHVRSQLEICVPLWNSALTKVEISRIENIQKMAFAIVLGRSYKSYDRSLKYFKFDTLKNRRRQLCLKFAKNCVKDPKHSHMFPKFKGIRARKSKVFIEPKCRTTRGYRSAIPYMTRLLNESN